jgi:hypothetical protein
MFFRKKPADDDDAQFGKLDELVGTTSDNPVADGIRRALQRPDLTPEDRREFEEALKRLTTEKPNEENDG